MLEYLSIKNFAIIDELAMSFGPGLTVLTGETGAGKSIIVDALKAVLGEKTDPSSIRSGEDTARIEAAFDPAAVGGKEDAGSDDELIIAREIRREGRGRATVNGSMVTISFLKSLGDKVVDLHGQHEHQSLLKTSVHLQALDSIGSLDPAREEFAVVFKELSRLRDRLENSRQDEKDRVARIEYLRYVISELGSSDLSLHEEAQLLEEEGILASAEKLHLAASTALESVYQAEGSAVEAVQKSLAGLKNMAETDSRLNEGVDLLQGAGAQLEEAGLFLRDYATSVHADPSRLEQIQERLVYLAGLKKKYGPSMEDVLDTLQKARGELDLMEEGEMNIDELRSQVAKLEGDAMNLARDLSRRRKEQAGHLEESVMRELRDLAMDKVKFSVSFREVEMGETGIDNVEFLISPNPGEPVMPLRKIASGGELSRVMLVLKRILAGAHAVPTLVFDEVDAGIGGKVAAILGRKLQDIAGYHQILCITHLAPVAACADNHVVVEKAEEKGRTVVRTKHLEEGERVEELARMMGGIEVSSGIVESARELLEEARG